MRTFKWIVRYLFFALLLAAAVYFTIYCFSVSSQLTRSIDDVSFIDTASRSVTEAGELVQRRDVFKNLGIAGLIAGGSIVVIIALLVVYNINEKKIIAFFAVGSKNRKVKKEKRISDRKESVKKTGTGASFAPVKPQRTQYAAGAGMPGIPTVPSAGNGIPTAPSAGNGIPTAPSAGNVVQQADRVNTKVTFCGQCGHRHEGSVAFCANCGAKIKKD